MAQRIVALEIAGDGIRAAVADRAWNSFSIAGTYEDQRHPDEADVSGALTRLINRVGRADITISALPGELVAKRLLALPFHDRRRLEQAVPFALEEHLPFAVDDSVVAFATVGHEGENSLVMAASARKADLRSHLELLAKAGLDPKTVTLSALALPSLVARSRNGSSSRHLLIDLDHDRTSLVFLDAGGTPRAIRTLTVGMDSASNGSDPNEASNLILSSIRQTLLAHQNSGAPADVILTGAAAALPDIRRELAEALEVNVRGADELDYSE